MENNTLRIKTKPWLFYSCLFTGILTLVAEVVLIVVFNRINGTFILGIGLFYMAYKFAADYIVIEEGNLFVQQTSFVSRSVSLRGITGIVNKNNKYIIKTHNKDIVIQKNYITTVEFEALKSILESVS